MEKEKEFEISIEEFTNKFFNLNPDGDLLYVYKLLSITFENIKHENKYNPATGELYTFNDIVDKYEEYLAYWDAKFGDREEKYIKADDKKMNPEDFLRIEGFTKSYPIPKKRRDYYLFGKNNPDKLLNMYNNFIENFK
jgi:hypothetical protein